MKERPILTAAHHEASEWIARLEAADVSLEDHKRFRAWLAASAENQRAYESVSRTWDKLDALKLIAPDVVRSNPQATVSRRAALLGGGTIAVAIAAGIALWVSSSTTTYASTLRTDVGGRLTEALQDGTQVELNASTVVNINFNGRSRSAIMDRGEALFTIADDPREFAVRMEFGSFSCSNAKFIVKVSPGLARVSVLEGVVQCEGSHPLEARTNEELIFTLGGVELAMLPPERAESRLAWRDNMLAFDGETLAEAAADVERQTGTRFVFDDPETANLRVGGYIDANDATAFASLVSANLQLSVLPQSDGSYLVTR